MSIIFVPEHANMQGAAALRTLLLSALDENPAVTLDLAEVVAADLCFVQLVEAGRLEAARRDKRLALATPATGAVRATLERAGLLTGFALHLTNGGADAEDADFGQAA